MVVVMDMDAPEGAIEAVVGHLTRAGCDVHRSSGQTRTLIGVVGSLNASDAAVVAEMEGVATVTRVSESYRLASRRFRKQSSIVEGAWGAIGSERPWIAVEAVGASVPMVDADAPPASLPYAVAAGGPFDAAITRFAEGPDDLGALACLSLHARPMGAKWPVLFVTREPTASAEAWIEDAEQELARGANQVVLLEAGGAWPGGPRTLDVAALARVSALTHLPVVVDVPRIAGSKREVRAIAGAAIAAGANGVILRAWAGNPGEVSRVPGTLPWEAATAVAEQLLAIGRAVRA